MTFSYIKVCCAHIFKAYYVLFKLCQFYLFSSRDLIFYFGCFSLLARYYEFLEMFNFQIMRWILETPKRVLLQLVKILHRLLNRPSDKKIPIFKKN